MDQALEIWATEADCSEISLDGVSDFARVWVFSAITSVGLLIMLIVPFVWCRKRAARVVPEGIVDESPTGATKARASEVEADLNRSEPDLAAAKRHLVRSSATVDGKWLSPCSAGLDKMCVIGGTGTSLYFGTLRSMGYLFATMAAITFPTTAFCLLGTFAPDNGQFLARTTIGNLGLYVDTQVLDPLLRIVRVNCDGASLSNLTAVFAWLDFAAVFILFVYLVRFRFYDIPKQIEDDDLQQVSVSDFSVLIEKLPARIPNQRDYERLLTEHLESRMRAVQNAHGDKKNPQVCEVTLVRDFKGRLDALQEQARLTQQIEVQKAYHNERKLAKLTNKKAKLDQKIEMQLPAEEEEAPGPSRVCDLEPSGRCGQPVVRLPPCQVFTLQMLPVAEEAVLRPWHPRDRSSAAHGSALGKPGRALVVPTPQADLYVTHLRCPAGDIIDLHLCHHCGGKVAGWKPAQLHWK